MNLCTLDWVSFVSGYCSTNLPIYMTASCPLEAAWKTTPMTVTTDTPNRPGLRPHLSEIGEAINAPAKAPACITETMLAARLALATLSPVKPKSLSRVSGFVKILL